MYSNVPNKREYMFISGKVCLLGSFKVKAKTSKYPQLSLMLNIFKKIQLFSYNHSMNYISIEFENYLIMFILEIQKI